jgi:hypothetical protein
VTQARCGYIFLSPPFGLFLCLTPLCCLLRSWPCRSGIHTGRRRDWVVSKEEGLSLVGRCGGWRLEVYIFFFVWLSGLLVEGSRSRRDCVPLVVGWLAGLYVIQVSGVGSKQKTVGPQLATGTERSLRRPLDVSFGSKEASPYDVFRLLLLLLLLVCVFLLQYYSATQLFNEYSFCSIAIQFNDISEYVIVVSF